MPMLPEQKKMTMKRTVTYKSGKSGDIFKNPERARKAARYARIKSRRILACQEYKLGSKISEVLMRYKVNQNIIKLLSSSDLDPEILITDINKTLEEDGEKVRSIIESDKYMFSTASQI